MCVCECVCVCVSVNDLRDLLDSITLNQAQVNSKPRDYLLTVKIISANLSIFYEKCYVTAIPSYDYFLQYLTKDNTTLYHTILYYCLTFLKEMKFFIYFYLVCLYTSVSIVSNKRHLNVVSNVRQNIVLTL